MKGGPYHASAASLRFNRRQSMTTKHFTLRVSGIVCLALASFLARAAEPLKVDTCGVTARILYEAPISGGHMPELKGKYKMRITEISIGPGGHVGDHNHLGPGIRQMTAGEMEYILPDKTIIYQKGDFFFETGDISHRVNNKTAVPNTHLLFEILPLDVKGASLIIPRDKPGK
jgi:quercetin dioxygenase-like cupin family protein